MKILNYHMFESKSDTDRQLECEMEMQRIYELCVEKGIEIFKHEIMLSESHDIIMMFYLPEKFSTETEYMYTFKKPEETEWRYYMVINGKNSNIIQNDVDALYWMKKRQKLLVK